MTREEIILDAIIRANKLGAQGLQVMGYIEPTSAMQPPWLTLTMQIPKEITAMETEWYAK